MNRKEAVQKAVKQMNFTFDAVLLCNDEESFIKKLKDEDISIEMIGLDERVTLFKRALVLGMNAIKELVGSKGFDLISVLEVGKIRLVSERDPKMLKTLIEAGMKDQAGLMHEYMTEKKFFWGEKEISEEGHVLKTKCGEDTFLAAIVRTAQSQEIVKAVLDTGFYNNKLLNPEVLEALDVIRERFIADNFKQSKKEIEKLLIAHLNKIAAPEKARPTKGVKHTYVKGIGKNNKKQGETVTKASGAAIGQPSTTGHKFRI